jgi:hypothetical protein
LHGGQDELSKLEQLFSGNAWPASLAADDSLSEQELSSLHVAVRLQEEEFKLHKKNLPTARGPAAVKKANAKLNTLDAFLGRRIGGTDRVHMPM